MRTNVCNCLKVISWCRNLALHPKTMSFRRKMVVAPPWHLRCKNCAKLCIFAKSSDSIFNRFEGPWFFLTLSLVEPLAWVSFSRVLRSCLRIARQCPHALANNKLQVRCMFFSYLCKLNQIYMYARRNKITKKTNSHESLHLGLTGFNTLKWLAYSSTISDEKDDQMPSLGRRWVTLTMAMVRASRWARLSILLALASPMAWLGRRGVVGVMIFPLPVPRFTRSCLFLQHTKHTETVRCTLFVGACFG